MKNEALGDSASVGLLKQVSKIYFSFLRHLKISSYHVQNMNKQTPKNSHTVQIIVLDVHSMHSNKDSRKFNKIHSILLGMDRMVHQTDIRRDISVNKYHVLA